MNRIQDNLVEYGERIKKIRRELAVSQKDFAAKLNIAASFLSEIESGKTKPGYNFLVKLAAEFDVNPTWILLGTGPMFIKEAPSIGEDDYGIHTESIKELLWYFKRSPLVRLSVTAFASKFLLDNEAIIKKDIKKNKPEEEK
jgi:transcriptional regulator with XRE-family HTH domain